MDKLAILLRDGYFPSQLPPSFSTEHLSELHEELAAELPAKLSRVPASIGEAYSQARTGHRRRPLTIPNPINQLYVCREIVHHWNSIEEHISKSKISVSKSQFSEDGDRAIELTDLSRLRELRITQPAGYRFILRTDISQFFPSLYTHAIPWAIHGKNSAKSNMRNLSNEYYGNRIDTAVRKCQSNQTLGIPIGPDTSHIISEILATSIDIEIFKSLGYWPASHRHVDDFFLCFDTYEEAEAGLAAVVRALHEYQFEINVSKTEIIAVDQFEDENWVRILSRKTISQEMKQQRSDIIEYFESILELCKKYDDESIIKFALKRSTSCLIWKENWDLYQAYITRIALAYPHNMETITRILATYNRLEYEIDEDLVFKLCSNVISRHAPLDHHSEVAWALWLANEFALEVPVQTAELISKLQSSVCALIALEMRANRLISDGLDTALWTETTTTKGLNSDLWLLSYEGTQKGWLAAAENNHVAQHQTFRHLAKNNIEFYDTDVELDPMINRTKLSDVEPDDIESLFDVTDDEFGYEFSEETREYID